MKIREQVCSLSCFSGIRALKRVNEGEGLFRKGTIRCLQGKRKTKEKYERIKKIAC